MSDEVEVSAIPITVEGEFVKASDRAVMGDKRIVRYLPIQFPGMKAPVMRPCLWTSPWEIFDPDLNEKVRFCLLLVNDLPPKPDIIAVRIATAALDKFPTGPVAW